MFSDIFLFTDNTFYKVVSNYLKHLGVIKWSFNNSKTDEIFNNNFQNQSKIHFAIFSQ